MSHSTAMVPGFNWAFLRPWIVCLTSALFFFYIFVLMTMFNAISADLMHDFQINSSQLGYLSAVYFYSNTLFLLPAGLIMDRFSTRRIILTSMIICVISVAGFALSPSITWVGIFRALAGFTNAFSFVSCILLASRWFPPQRMALVIGCIVTIGVSGGMLAQTPLAELSATIGWRHASLIIAGIGLFIMGLIWLLVADTPEKKSFSAPITLTIKSFFNSLRLATHNPQNWLCGTYTCLLNLPIMLLGALWGSLYLTQTQHFSQTAATLASSMLFFGTIIGSPIAGWFSDNLGSRRLPMILAGVLSLIVFLIFMLTPHLTLRYSMTLLFALGFFTSAQIIGYPTITESNPIELTGTATGLASALIMLGAGLSQQLFGWILSIGWHGVLYHNVPIYSNTNFFHSLLIIPVALVLAIIAAFFIRETHCRMVTAAS